jgi:Protein of unknown function (DUF3096)
MNTLIIHPVIALVAGIAILIWPRILNFIVAAYLIIFGIIGLIDVLSTSPT